MLESNNSNINQQEHRAFTILKLLWKKFWKQTLMNRIITVLVMLLTIMWMFVFYSSFILWQIFTFVMTKVLLFLIEWYLKREE